MSEEFRMDKTAFKATNAEDADDHVSEWRNKSLTERLNAAWFLIRHAYGAEAEKPMDKTVFSMRKRI